MKIRLGVSSCLLGQRVRYDGDHKRDVYITEMLARYFEFVPVCPEVAIGLGVPRPPIRLVGTVAKPRAVGVDDPSLDVTAALATFGRRQGRSLRGISGYIFKSRSPSCGLLRVEVFTRGGGSRRGTGVYAAALRAARPLLPVVEEEQLRAPALRDNFLERVFAYQRWQRLHASGISPARLVAFHAAHALSLMAHGSVRCAALERLAARADRRSARSVAARYFECFMEALAHPATRHTHSGALRRAVGYLAPRLDARDRAELRRAIAAYRTGAVSILVPVTLLRRHLRRHPDPRLTGQYYLYPDPRELALRY